MNILKPLIIAAIAASLVVIGACNQANQMDNTTVTSQGLNNNGILVPQQQNMVPDVNNQRLILMAELEKTPMNGQDYSVIVKILMRDPQIAAIIENYWATQDPAILDQLIELIDQRIWEDFTSCDPMMTCTTDPSDNAEMLTESVIDLVIDYYEDPQAIDGLKAVLANYGDMMGYIDALVADLMADMDIVQSVDSLAKSIAMNGDPSEVLLNELQSFEDSL